MVKLKNKLTGSFGVCVDFVLFGRGNADILWREAEGMRSDMNTMSMYALDSFRIFSYLKLIFLAEIKGREIKGLSLQLLVCDDLRMQ